LAKADSPDLAVTAAGLLQKHYAPWRFGMGLSRKPGPVVVPAVGLTHDGRLIGNPDLRALAFPMLEAEREAKKDGGGNADYERGKDYKCEGRAEFPRKEGHGNGQGVLNRENGDGAYDKDCYTENKHKTLPIDMHSPLNCKYLRHNIILCYTHVKDFFGFFRIVLRPPT
jgi:hypothetical protein